MSLYKKEIKESRKNIILTYLIDLDNIFMLLWNNKKKLLSLHNYVDTNNWL